MVIDKECIQEMPHLSINKNELKYVTSMLAAQNTLLMLRQTMRWKESSTMGWIARNLISTTFHLLQSLCKYTGQHLNPLAVTPAHSTNPSPLSLLPHPPYLFLLLFLPVSVFGRETEHKKGQNQCKESPVLVCRVLQSMFGCQVYQNVSPHTNMSLSPTESTSLLSQIGW